MVCAHAPMVCAHALMVCAHSRVALFAIPPPCVQLRRGRVERRLPQRGDPEQQPRRLARRLERGGVCDLGGGLCARGPLLALLDGLLAGLFDANPRTPTARPLPIPPLAQVASAMRGFRHHDRTTIELNALGYASTLGVGGGLCHLKLRRSFRSCSSSSSITTPMSP